MNQSNPTLAKRIADLERQLSSTKDFLESSMLSEAAAKQYAEEVDKQNQALAAQVDALRDIKRYSEGTTTVRDGYERWNVPVLNEDKNGKIIKAEEFDAILSKVPQHHLRQVRADAVQCYVNALLEKKNRQGIVSVSAFAEEHIASILAGKE